VQVEKISEKILGDRAGGRVPRRIETVDGCLPAVENQAPAPCNTGAFTRQAPESGATKRRETGGVDWLSVSLYGEWSEETWPEVERQFDELSRKARDEGEAFWTAANGEAVKMRANGAWHGVHCAWVLDWNGCTISVVRRREHSEKMLSVHVELKSLPLMQEGPQRTWERCQALLTSVGFLLKRSVCGRLDVCVDLPGVAPQKFWDVYAGSQFISQVKERKDSSKPVGQMFHGTDPGEVHGFTRGHRETVSLRVYDKRMEVRRDLVKEQVMLEKRWDFDASPVATRVEFEVHRERLKEKFGCNSVEDVFATLPQISYWLCCEWFRLVDGVPDRKNRNQTRLPVHPLWGVVQQCFAEWVGGELLPPVKITPEVVRPDVAARFRQGLGCFASALGHEGFATVAARGLAAVEEYGAEVCRRVRFEIGQFTERLESRLSARSVRLGLVAPS
jgi:hypothetical protein